MESEAEDILVPIPDEDLPKLAEIYRKHVDQIPQIFSTINTVIKWKKCEESRHLLNIYSPNNCWESNGTFILLLEFGCYDLIIFTLDKTCRALLEGLTQTKRINFNKKSLFYCLHYDHHSTILELIKAKKLKMTFNIPCDIYSVKKEIALNYNLEKSPSEEVYVKKLDKSHAPIINSLWPHRYETSEIYLGTLIEFNGGFGLFTKTDSQLVAWILITPMGQLGILETVPEFKRKGYGSFLIKYMSREIARGGHDPLGTVIVYNIPSQAMFNKMEFKSLGFYTFVGVSPGL